MKDFLLRVGRAALGLAVVALGVCLSIQANVGLAPWDCLCMGIARHVGVSYGTISICISLTVLLVDVLMREPVGVGTLIDALVCGMYVDGIMALGLIPVAHNPWMGVPMMAAGLFLLALGQYIYMSAALGCGPRDTLLVALGKRLRRWPIGAVNVLILLVVLAVGALLGGPVGVGTVMGAFGTGLAVQGVCRAFRFEPRDVRHEDLLTSLRRLARRAEHCPRR